MTSKMKSLVDWLVPAVLHAPLRALLVSALRLGPVPEHVAVIMDGNRRFARRRGEPVHVGYTEGFEALKRVLSFFLRLGVKHVTVYAFSIENFNRDPAEVEALMSMARARLPEMCEKEAIMHKYGVRVRVLGRRDLLPLDVQESCALAERLTAHNTERVLNLCCPYTSQEEITTAIQRTADACDNGSIQIDEVTQGTISSNLYTSAPPLDMLIRTSGVTRLSDFLLWQANETTTLHFLRPDWPDIGVLDIVPILLEYQADKAMQTLQGWSPF